MIWYYIASLFPFLLAVLAALGSEAFTYGGFVFMAIGVAGLDVCLPKRAEAETSHYSGLTLSILLSLAHVALFFLSIYAIAGLSGLAPGARLALMIMVIVIFGQISNSNAHELIHNTSLVPRFLGILVYCTLLFGHHATAHLAIHHRYVATALDPNSPAPGQSLYAFLRQAWIGSFLRGLQVERARLVQNGLPAASWRNPYWLYIALSAGGLGVSFAIGGGLGVSIHGAIAFFAIMQLLTSDYVQHYGLRRQRLPDGRYEPVAAHHSWNAPKAVSRRMMLNAPLHSEHHMRPKTAFPALSRPSAPLGPMLPHSLSVMATIAVFPRLWRRVMAREIGRLPPLKEPHSGTVANHDKRQPVQTAAE